MLVRITPSAGRATVASPHTPAGPGELAVSAGDVLTIDRLSANSGWVRGRLSGAPISELERDIREQHISEEHDEASSRSGWIPADFVRISRESEEYIRWQRSRAKNVLRIKAASKQLMNTESSSGATDGVTCEQTQTSGMGSAFDEDLDGSSLFEQMDETETQQRLDSFFGWPHVSPSAQDCAAAGLHFAPLPGKGDRCKCLYCGLTLHTWKMNDQPIRAHRASSPHCAIVRRIDAARVGLRRGMTESMLFESTALGSQQGKAAIFSASLRTNSDPGEPGLRNSPNTILDMDKASPEDQNSAVPAASSLRTQLHTWESPNFSQEVPIDRTISGLEELPPVCSLCLRFIWGEELSRSFRCSKGCEILVHFRCRSSRDLLRCAPPQDRSTALQAVSNGPTRGQSVGTTRRPRGRTQQDSAVTLNVMKVNSPSQALRSPQKPGYQSYADRARDDAKKNARTMRASLFRMNSEPESGIARKREKNQWRKTKVWQSTDGDNVCTSIAEAVSTKEQPMRAKLGREDELKLMMLLDRSKVFAADTTEIEHFQYKYFTSTEIFKHRRNQSLLERWTALLHEVQHRGVDTSSLDFTDGRVLPYARIAPSVGYDASSSFFALTPLPVRDMPIAFYFPNDFEKIIKCDGTKTVQECVERVYAFMKSETELLPPGLVPADYWVQIVGTSAYLLPETAPLQSFTHVLTCLRRNERIAVSLIPKFQPARLRLSHSINSLQAMAASYALPGESMSNIFAATKFADPEHGKSLPHLGIHSNYCVRVIEVLHLESVLPALSKNKKPKEKVFVEVELFHGASRLNRSCVGRTNSVDVDGAKCSALYFAPRTLEAGSAIDFPIGVWAIPLAQPVINFAGEFSSGIRQFRCWPKDRANPLGTCTENTTTAFPLTVTLEFVTINRYDLPIVFQSLSSDSVQPRASGDREESAADRQNLILGSESSDSDQLVEKFVLLEQLSNRDPLYRLTRDERTLLWENRQFMRNKSSALAKLLLSIEWDDPPKVAEVQRALGYWNHLSGEDALQLLDARFAAPQVREYACECLGRDHVSDDDFVDYLLQLVQALKHEQHHDSALARLLLDRALNAQNTVGCLLYWLMRSELRVDSYYKKGKEGEDNSAQASWWQEQQQRQRQAKEMTSDEIAERYGLILEAFLRGCDDSFLDELLKQHDVFQKFLTIAIDIQQKEGLQVIGGVPVPNPGVAQRRSTLLQDHLTRITLPEEFSFPYNTSVRVRGGRAGSDGFGIITSKCRVMDSAKTPLWLAFKSADPQQKRATQILFKAGDDLRQDMLTLQMLRVMDKLWKSQGLDLGLSLYNCIVTGGSHIGLVEIVENCNTFANIQKERGKRGVFKQRALWDWLVREPRNNTVSDETLRDNFLISSAAYCVATYVMGIGDRHNDNIMLTRTGHMLHIDFGHFLGHIKKVAGIINRERAPFIFTPEMFYVITQTKVKRAQRASKKATVANDASSAADSAPVVTDEIALASADFQRFVTLCCRAYNILRRSGHVFISLFAMMLSTGIPELKSFADIDYLRKSFAMEDTDQDAAARFTKMIYSALGAKSTTINFFLHNLAH